MIKVVLFDFGGVLTESGRSGFITDTVAELYGVDPASLDIGQYHAELRRGRGDEDELFERLNQKYSKHVTKQMFLDRMHQSFVPSPGVYNLAKKLREHGIGTGILSNIFAMNARILEGQGWYDGFDPVILSCDEGYAKPDKEFYEIALRKVGVPASDILFVDDQEKCLGPARGFGMQVVEAKNPDQIVCDVKAAIMSANGIAL